MTQTDPQPSERRINLKVPEDVHIRLKIRAAKDRTSMQDLLLRWVEEKLADDEGHDA